MPGLKQRRIDLHATAEALRKIPKPKIGLLQRIKNIGKKNVRYPIVSYENRVIAEINKTKAVIRGISGIKLTSNGPRFICKDDVLNLMDSRRGKQ